MQEETEYKLHFNPYFSLILSVVKMFFKCKFRQSDSEAQCHACLLSPNVVSCPYSACNHFNNNT